MATALEKAGARRAGRAQLDPAGYPWVWSIRNHSTWATEGEGTRGKYYLANINRVTGRQDLKFGSADALKNTIEKLGDPARILEGAVHQASGEEM